MSAEESSQNNLETASQDVEVVKKMTAADFTDRISRIDAQLAAYNMRSESEDEISKAGERPNAEHQAALAELGDLPLSEENRKALHEKMAREAIDLAHEENKKYDELLEKRATSQVACLFGEDEKSAAERLGRLKEMMGENDYATALNILKSHGELFNRRGKLLHATNSYVVKNMRDMGKLSGGLWQRGVSFSDGDAPIALSFNLLWEDIKTKGGLDPAMNKKKINGDKYRFESKKDDFVGHILEVERERLSDDDEYNKVKAELLSNVKRQYREDWGRYITVEEFRRQLKDKLYGDLVEKWKRDGLDPAEIKMKERAFLKRAALFKKIMTTPPNEAEQEAMYGVTMAFDKHKLEEQLKDELTPGQSTFEVRSNGEVDFDKIETIFVPASEMNNARDMVKNKKIEIRPSEELEIIRLLEEKK